MPVLTLLRHAKSSWDDSVRTDFDRPLNAKGRRAAATMGAWMAREGCAFDCVIASPALRVQQTIEGVQDGLGHALAPVFDRRVYMATRDILSEIVASVPASVERLLLIGHNPGLEELALWLVPESDGTRAQIAEKYPTAALAEIALTAWASNEGAGRLSRFVRPRDIDSSLGPDHEREN